MSFKSLNLWYYFNLFYNCKFIISLFSNYFNNLKISRSVKTMYPLWAMTSQYSKGGFDLWYSPPRQKTSDVFCFALFFVQFDTAYMDVVFVCSAFNFLPCRWNRYWGFDMVQCKVHLVFTSDPFYSSDHHEIFFMINMIGFVVVLSNESFRCYFVLSYHNFLSIY